MSGLYGGHALNSGFELSLAFDLPRQRGGSEASFFVRYALIGGRKMSPARQERVAEHGTGEHRLVDARPEDSFQIPEKQRRWPIPEFDGPGESMASGINLGQLLHLKFGDLIICPEKKAPVPTAGW